MKILVVCNAGMSSSILMKKMSDYAASIQEEIETKAVSSSAVADQAGKWDVCLVAPQIRFSLNEIQKAIQIPCDVVEMRTYAMADGKAAYEQAKKLLG